MKSNPPKSSNKVNIVDWFVCDDIRSEVSGKSSYVGVYQNNMLFREIPAMLPVLWFYIKIKQIKKKPEKLFLQIEQPNGANLVGPIEVNMKPLNESNSPNENQILHIGLSPFKVDLTGLHKIMISLDGKDYSLVGTLNMSLTTA